MNIMERWLTTSRRPVRRAQCRCLVTLSANAFPKGTEIYNWSRCENKALMDVLMPTAFTTDWSLGLEFTHEPVPDPEASIR